MWMWLAGCGSVQQIPPREPACVRDEVPSAVVISTSQLPKGKPQVKTRAELVLREEDCAGPFCRQVTQEEFAVAVGAARGGMALEQTPIRSSPHVMRRSIELRWGEHACYRSQSSRFAVSDPEAFLAGFNRIGDVWRGSEEGVRPQGVRP